MDFIQTSNKQVDKFGPGKHGFSAGNPAGGVLATYFSPDWADGVQQEIINAIEENGMAADGADLKQLAKAISTQSTDATTRYRSAATAGCACLVEI